MRAIELHTTLLQHLHLECDINGEPGDSKNFLRFPPSIYYSRLSNYPLRILRAKKDTSYRIWDLRRIHAQVNGLLHSIHAMLTPQQAAECLHQDISILVADGNLCAPIILHRGEFFQHICPSANPFFTLDEVGFICTALGILRFYGVTDIVRILDMILVMPYPNEDLVTTLLLNHHLKYLGGTSLVPTSSLDSLFQTARNLREQQHCFYSSTWIDSDLTLPPSIPPSLREYFRWNNPAAIPSI
ncbi:hypothetical protein V8E55_010502 [Tylopilus felleus]